VNCDRDVMANSHHMSGRAPAKTRRKSKGILQIARQVSATIGAEFFRALVGHLSDALAAECVYVGEFVGGQVERVKTLSASVDGQTDVAFDYPLAGSASATAALGAASVCKSGARDKFREDAILSRIAAEAFVGVPLLNAHQQAVGVIMAVYRRPVSSLQVPRSVLRNWSVSKPRNSCAKAKSVIEPSFPPVPMACGALNLIRPFRLTSPRKSRSSGFTATDTSRSVTTRWHDFSVATRQRS